MESSTITISKVGTKTILALNESLTYQNSEELEESILEKQDAAWIARVKGD